MRRLTPATIGPLALVALLGLTMFLPANALAVVSDATFTGGGLGRTTISITNEETKETVRGDREKTGAPIVIPLESRKWRAGSHYTVTFTDPNSQKPVTVKGVEFKDGHNEISLSTLLAMAGGAGTGGAGSATAAGGTPGMPSSIVDLHVGWRFFNIKEIGPSVALRADYSPPIVFNEDYFNLRPYVGGWVIPSVHIDSHKAIDFNHVFQKKIDSGTIYGMSGGVKHISDMARWGLKADDAKIIGVASAGIGWVHYGFDLKKRDFSPDFTDAHNFNSSGNGFRMEYNLGLGINRNNWFVGLKGGIAPTWIDIFNGGTKTVWEGNVGVVGGWNF
jgi:hypothetical protein